MIKNVALMTPTYRGDLDRFELLCESIDRFVTGYQRHYVIVNDDDLPFFARFENSRRTVLPSSRFLPLTVKSRLPVSSLLIAAYLRLPFSPMGKQMLLRARPRRS